MIDPKDDEAPLSAALRETPAHSPRSATIPPPKATLEERVAAAIVQPGPTLKPFDVWAADKKTDATWVRAAAVTHHWAKGRQVDEATFDEAVAGVQNVEMR